MPIFARVGNVGVGAAGSTQLIGYSNNLVTKHASLDAGMRNNGVWDVFQNGTNYYLRNVAASNGTCFVYAAGAGLAKLDLPTSSNVNSNGKFTSVAN